MSCYRTVEFTELAGLKPKRIPLQAQLRIMLINQAESICEKCNQFFPYPEIHHIDGDNANNELDNLIVVCPNCHVIMTREMIEEEVVIH
jgi:Zn finger protein HypA/HybF involved in hydrogenase expression